MRSASLIHMNYAASARDFFVNAGPAERLEQAPSRDVFRIGGSRGLPNGMWALLFPDDWTGDRFSKSLRCPRDPAWIRGLENTGFALPNYWMSRSLWLDPASLREPAPPDTPLWRGNRVGDVRFPSRKVLLYEQVAYCLADPRAREDIENGHTPDWPGAVGFVDGSIRRPIRSDGVPGYFAMPFDLTVDGVAGVDVP